jgi:hypothetical protein
MTSILGLLRLHHLPHLALEIHGKLGDTAA